MAKIYYISICATFLPIFRSLCINLSFIIRLRQENLANACKKNKAVDRNRLLSRSVEIKYEDVVECIKVSCLLEEMCMCFC